MEDFVKMEETAHPLVVVLVCVQTGGLEISVKQVQHKSPYTIQQMDDYLAICLEGSCLNGGIS